MKNKFNKRLFWNLVSLCPKIIRAKIVRSRFKINFDLDPELVFKEATTKDEVEQAFNLVYDSYINLNYIDRNCDQLHFTKYLALPTTTVLVIKLKEEVIGTMSIILDSSLGLPTETTWNISECKKNGINVAEISALAIKREMKGSKGHLLLPLINFLFSYCTKILKLDRIVIATTYEVEPFYIDLLLFKKIPDSQGQKHDLVKGNKSSCCFLELNAPMKKSYYEVYAGKDKKHNLYHYFFESKIPNIKLPTKLISVQAQLKEKNLAILELLKEKLHVFSRFSEKDQLIISNLEPNKQLVPKYTGEIKDRIHPRLTVTINGRIEINDSNVSVPVKILDASQSGLKIRLINNDVDLYINDEISFKLEKHLSALVFFATVMWVEKDKAFGCVIQAKSEQSWQNFYRMVWGELQETPEVESIEENNKKQAS